MGGVICLCGIGLFSWPVRAASTLTWDGGGGDNNWTTAANWVGDVAPVAGDSLIFDATGVAARPTANNDLTLGTSFGSITISAAGYTITGNSLSLTTGLTADTYSTGTSTVSLIIGGAGSVTMSGTGTAILTLSGVNTFTGGLTIESGTVTAMTSNKALGGATGTGTVTIGYTSGSANATLLVGTTGLNYANPIVLATGTIGTLTVGNTGTAISPLFSGGVTGTNNLTINENATTGTIEFRTAPINNIGTVTNIGAGSGTTGIAGGIGSNVTAITENSTTSGLTIYTTAATVVTVNSGGTTLTNNNASGTKQLSINTAINGTGNLILNNNGVVNSGISTQFSAINNTGTITNSGTGTGSVTVAGGIGANVNAITQNSTTSALTVSGALTVNSTATTLTNTAGTKILTISGGTTGTGNLILNNNSSLASGITLSTTSVNHAGAITNSGSGSGLVSITGGIGANVNAITQNSTTSALTVSGALTVNGVGTTLTNTAGTKALTVSGGVTGMGNLILNNNSSLSAGITLITTSVNNTGTITNSGTGSGAVTITASIGLNVTAVTENSGTSALTIGALVVNSSGTTLSNNNSSGSAVFTHGAVTGTGNLILNNNSSIVNGIISTASHNNIGTITNSGSGTGAVAIDTISTNVTGVIQNSATSQLTLGGSSSFTSGVTVKSGTVLANVATSNVFGTSASVITLGDTSGSANATILINKTGVTFPQSIVLATGTTGTLTIGNTGTAISTTFSGGVTGTNNLTINENATTGTITFSTAAVNNAGTVTNIGAGSGTTTISSGIGSNVTGITENSATSALTIGTTAITVNSAGTTLTNANASGSKLFTISSGVTGTGNLAINNNSSIANGVTFSTTAINNVGVVTNSGTGSGAETLSVGIGSNVTGITENSATSALTVSGALTANGSGTTIINSNPSGSAILTISGGATGTGNIILRNNSAISGGITISTTSINNVGSITNSGNGAGQTNLDDGIGVNVIGVIQDSSTSALFMNGTVVTTGATTITSGNLVVDGTVTDSDISLNGGVLSGVGTAGDIIASSFGGTVAPGSSPGILNSGSVDWSAGPTTFFVQLDGTTVGTTYDQLNVTGTVNITGAALSGTVGFTPAVTNTFTIINNDGSDGITGTFSGLGEGELLMLDGKQFRINYAAGTGNDVVLTYVGTLDPAESTLTPVSSRIMANGTSIQILTVIAKNADGSLAGFGGDTVTILSSGGSGGAGVVSAVTDNGDGTYTATVTSAAQTGREIFISTLAGSPVESGIGSQTEAFVTYFLNGGGAENALPQALDVAITGIAEVGQVLTGSYTYFDANGDIEGDSGFRWLRDGTGIQDATGITYTVVEADAGKTMTFEVAPSSPRGSSPGFASVSSGVLIPAEALPVVQEPGDSLGEILAERARRVDALPVSVHSLVKLADDRNPATQFDSAVYYVGADGYRHAFVNSKVYFTWFCDFSLVRIIAPSVMAKMGLGESITYRPGFKMVKFLTSRTVYAVGAEGVLHPIPTEADAVLLYGENWNRNIDDISDAFFSDYTIGVSTDDISFDPSALSSSVGYPSDNLGLVVYVPDSAPSALLCH